jgi:hypothetical protein
VKRRSSRGPGAIAIAALLGAIAGLLTGGGAATAGRTADPPRNTSRPLIAGIQREGQTLRASPGTWAGTQPITYSYQWTRCTSQLSNCTTLQGKTSRDYALTASDVGRRLVVSVTAKNAAGARTVEAATQTIGPRGTAPRNTAPPTIAGTPQSGQTLTAANGTWTGTSVSYAYRWQRCNAQGNACAAIGGATRSSYVLGTADVGNTLRITVTGWSAFGTAHATSAQTAVVAAAPPPGPGGQIKLPNGLVSIPVTSVAPPERLIVDRVSFSPSPVRSHTPLNVTFRVVDTRGFVVRDALVFVRSTPLVTTTPPEQPTGQDGTVTLQLLPQPSFPLRRGHSVQFFVRARKAGDNVLAGVSARRLVQVRTAPPAG